MARSDYTHKAVNDERVELTEAEIDALVARDVAWEADAYDRAWANIREERDRRIAETDFYALSDVTMSDAMTIYRTSLRDLPASISNPVDWVDGWNAHTRGDEGASDPWPTKPGGE